MNDREADRDAFKDWHSRNHDTLTGTELHRIERQGMQKAWIAALAYARQQSGDAAEEAADQTKWASHYAKWAGRLYDALLDLEQAYNNKHSPQHRRAALAEARTVLAEYDAAAAPAQQRGDYVMVTRVDESRVHDTGKSSLQLVFDSREQADRFRAMITAAPAQQDFASRLAAESMAAHKAQQEAPDRSRND